MFQSEIKADENAIYKLIEEDIEKLFYVLGLAYKTTPTYKTMHNFGAFLSKYGHEIPFLSKKYLDYAKELLLGANEQNSTFITLSELGDLFLSKRKYRSAILYYVDALKQDASYGCYYNLAQCYYYLQDYNNMNQCLAKAVRDERFSDREMANLLELFGFSCALIGEKKQAAHVLNLLQKNSEYSNHLDMLKLAYMCEEYSFIVDHYKRIFDEWMIEANDYKIVYQAITKVRMNSINEYQQFVKTKMIDFYADNPDIEPDPDFLEAFHSNNCTPNTKLVLVQAFQCNFYQ